MRFFLTRYLGASSRISRRPLHVVRDEWGTRQHRCSLAGGGGGLGVSIEDGVVAGENRQRQRRNTGILPAPASKLAGDPVRCAQNDEQEQELRTQTKKMAGKIKR